MAERDPRIMLVTGDLGFGVLNDFSARFPKQFINAGVAEQNMTGLATGLALDGYIVYTYSIANFVFMRCLEQIRNDAAYHRANVNVVCVGGGFSYGALGISHHATEDIAMMRSLPGCTVFCPSDAWEAREVTRASADLPGVCYLRLDKSFADTPSPSGRLLVGRARTIRQGEDFTFVTAGGILEEVLHACDRLAEIGIRPRVLSLPTIKPLDTRALEKAARETGGIITVEEHTLLGGIGSAVAEALLESPWRPALFTRIGLNDQFSSVVGSQSFLRSHYRMDADAIFERAVNFVSSKANSLVA